MDLDEFLTQHHITFKRSGEHHHATHGRLQIDCPFCSPRSTKFRMGMTSRFASCWTCGGHSLYDTMLELDIDKKSISGYLSERTDTLTKKKVVLGRLKIPAGISREFLSQHKKYLRNRGFDWARLRRLWGVRCFGIDDLYPWRLYIPILDETGQVRSYTTRTIDDNRSIMRYVSARPENESIHHKSLLYGEQYANHSIIVVEGPTDVWRIGKGAVATLGTEYTEDQVSRIAAYPKRYVCFDPEPLAQEKARQLCSELKMLPGETYMVELEGADDPEMMDTKGLKELRALIE